MRSAGRAQGCACRAILLLAVSGATKLDREVACIKEYSAKAASVSGVSSLQRLAAPGDTCRSPSLTEIVAVGVFPSSAGLRGNLRFYGHLYGREPQSCLQQPE